MIHKHHRKRRSQGGDDSPENLIELTPLQHHWVHQWPALAYEHGLLVKSHDDPAEIEADLPGFLAALEGRTSVGTQVSGGEEPMQTTVEGEEVPHSHVVGPGEKPCPKCKGKGKVREEPKDESLEQAPARPKTVVSIRVPKDERENGAEVLRGLWDGTIELLMKAGMLRSDKGADYYADVAAHVFFQQNFNPEAPGD